MAVLHRLISLATLLALAGCASADLSAAEVETRSNCHTGAGELVAAPSCQFSHSRTVTHTTTTTTTTTTEPTSDQAAPAPGDDGAR